MRAQRLPVHFELVHVCSKPARTEDVEAVVKDMQNSPTVAFLCELGLHERIVLAALLNFIRGEGVDEMKWAGVRIFPCVSDARAARYPDA